MAALNPCSTFDLFLHRIAFASPRVQLAVAETESNQFARDLEQVEMGLPIFITSPLRAGTTILLLALKCQPESAADLYRDIPSLRDRAGPLVSHAEFVHA